jgi:outer membrane receptor protein involved in Fe transport
VGGAVNVINNKPDDDLSFELKAGYDDVERHEVSGIANIPLGENAAARFGAFYIDQNDGFITDQNTGETVDQQEYFGVRGALRADFSPSTTATVTLEHYDSTAPGFSALGQRITPNTVALPAFLGGPQSGDLDPGPFEAIDSRVGEVEIEETSIFAELESDWGIGDLTAIFVYKQRDGNRFNEDLDSFLGFQGVDILGITTDLTVAQTEDFERFGGEIRLASKPESNRRWLIGADFQTFDDIVVTANDGTSGLGGLAALATREENFTEELTSFSAFGLIGFDLSERLDLTLEARLQNDSKDFVYTRDQSGAIVIDTGDLDDSWTRFLPAATLSYDMNDDQIVFLRAASGYRPGGFNTGVDTTSVDLIPYDPETAYSFEAGWKGTTDGGVRFGLNAFYVITDDVQAVSTLSTMDTTTALQNIGDTDIYGLEGEISGVVDAGSGRIRWGVSAATTQGSFADGAVITTSGGGNMVEVIDLSGARVNRTRDYVASANAFYFGPLTSSLDWFGGGSIQAEGGGFENASGDTSSATGRELEDFFLVDVRIGIRGETWTFSIFGKNLTDEVYRVQTVLGNAYYNEPQKFGAEFKLRFGG